MKQTAPDLEWRSNTYKMKNLLQITKGLNLGQPEAVSTLNRLIETLHWISPIVNQTVGQTEPPEDMRYDGLIAYADGINWKPNGTGVKGTWRWNGIKKLWENEAEDAASNASLSAVSQIEIPDMSLKCHIGTDLIDTATATGTQDVTGVGFPAKVVIFLANQGISTELSIGFSNQEQNRCVFKASTNWTRTDAHCMVGWQSAGNDYRGKVTGFNDDGFSILWTRTGTPTGVFDFYFLALG